MNDVMRPRFFAVPKNSTMESLQSFGDGFAAWQRDANWMIGDLARYAEARWPESWHQVFPPDISPGLVDRCKAVAKAYPTEEERQTGATWTQYMRLSHDPDRIAKLQQIVDAGLTTDESRKAVPNQKPRWLLAVDANYWLARTFHTGAGIAAGDEVCGWFTRTVERLKAKGLTDVVFCFDSKASFRKELTKDWEKPYKSRPSKDRQWMEQLPILEAHLQRAGFRCACVDGFEADDLMASYAAQFDGKVTLWAQDKDMRQCLSERVNMLMGAEWIEDETSGEQVWHGKWLSAKEHTEETGIRPDQWPDWQAIAGDPTDSIGGAEGIGKIGAADLIKEFGTLDAVLKAAADSDERIKQKKREALLVLAEQVEIVRQLVTLCTDISIPLDTRIP